MKYSKLLFVAGALAPFSLWSATFFDGFGTGTLDPISYYVENSPEVSISELSGVARFDGAFPLGMSESTGSQLNLQLYAAAGASDSWSAEVTATIDTSLTLGQDEAVGIALVARNSDNDGDQAQIGFYRANLSGSTDTFVRFAVDDGGTETLESFNTASITGDTTYLSLDYDGSTDTLSAAWGNSAHGEETFGSTFMALANWSSYGFTQFTVELVGAVLDGGDMAYDAEVVIDGSDYYIDDFQVTGDLSLVPEPSAFALMAGVFSLLIVGRRRR